MGTAGDGARRDRRLGVARCEMGEGAPRGGLGRANGVVSRDEGSKELGIFVGCRSVDGVDKPVGLVAVMERAEHSVQFF